MSRWLAFALLVLVPACSSTSTPTVKDAGDDDESGPPECMAIMEACHPKDVGAGAVHDCHEVAHKGVAADCKSRQAECVATCNAAPVAGDGGADGSH